MRVLMSSTWGHGHVRPMLPLALAFRAAGHEVLWAGSGGAPAVVGAAGLAAVAAGLNDEQVRAAEHDVRVAAAGVSPVERSRLLFPRLFGGVVAPAMVRDLLPLARRWRPDLIVHEHAEFAAPLVAAVLGRPSVTHAFGGAIPVDILDAAGREVAGLWSDHGRALPPHAGSFRTAYLDICPPSVQTVPLGHLAQRLAVRPVIRTAPGAPPDRTGRPLVYVTFGTVHRRPAVVREVLRGLTRLPVDVLVAGDAGELGPQPDHVRVERWVDQAEVIERAAAVVSHGGSGTVLGALAASRPQLCLPHAADQFRNATGLLQAGAGLVLTPDEIGAEAVADAVHRLLDTPSFRESAAAVGREIEAMPSPAETVSDLTRLV